MDNVRDLLANLLAAGLFALPGFRPGGLHVVLAQFRGRSQMLICAENPFDTRRRVLVVAGV